MSPATMSRADWSVPIGFMRTPFGHTATPLLRMVVLASPNWPDEFSPQHHMPDVVEEREQACMSPAANSCDGPTRDEGTTFCGVALAM